MASVLFGLLSAFASSLLARVLISSGLVLIVGAGMGVVVRALLDQAASYIGGLPSVALQLFLLGGFADAISIIGGALLTRATLATAGRVLGVGLKGE